MPCLFLFTSFPILSTDLSQNKCLQHTEKPPGKTRDVATLKPQAVSQAMTEGAQLVPRARVAQLQVWIWQRFGWPDLKAGTTSGHVLPSTSTDPPRAYQTKGGRHVQLLWREANSPFGIIQFCVSTLRYRGDLRWFWSHDFQRQRSSTFVGIWDIQR